MQRQRETDGEHRDRNSRRATEGASASSDPAGPLSAREEVTGNRHTQEFGDARGQPWPGLGLHARTGAPHAPSGASFLVPGQLGSGAGYGLARGQAGTLCATCSPLTSCWVAEDVILAGRKGPFAAAAPSTVLRGRWAQQPRTTSRRGRTARPGSSWYRQTWGLTARRSPCLFSRRGGFQGFSLGPPS